MTIGAGGGGGGTGQQQQPSVELKDYQVLEKNLKELKDFFGAGLSDEMGRQALRTAHGYSGQYDVQYATNWLLDRNVIIAPGGNPSQTPVLTKPMSPAESAKLSKDADSTMKAITDGRQTTTAGASEDTDLQKAIALSLTEQQSHQTQHQRSGFGGQISAEEQELSKVIEASILENNKKGIASHDLRQSSLFFVDPANPHERERQEFWPVGLKNVGNTCWFSVVTQALYHLPIFRRRLLNFDLDVANRKCATSDEAASSSASPSLVTLPRELEFTVELRKLFALLLGCHRKYVDPSGAVDILRKQDSLQLRNIGGLDCGQQDVSEFTHLLLEWLEEAFKIALPSTDINAATAATQGVDHGNGSQRMDVDVVSSRDNAIEQLFYGTFVIENMVNYGSPAEAMETAGAAGAHAVVIDEAPLEVEVKEERFSQYPLQVVGCETLHDSMEKSLCPDTSAGVEHWLKRLPPVFLFELSRFRYNQTDKKPEKLHSKFRFPKVLYVDRYLRENKTLIREKRKYVGRLRQQLYTLKYELEKLENFRWSKMPLANVLGLTLDFIGRGEGNQSISCDTEPMDGCEPAATGDATGDGAVSPQTPNFRYAADATGAELEVMERCMTRWRGQILQLVEDLMRKIAQVEKEIESVYCEPGFQQHPYSLHAVLVHEGQATLGHYWAFIFDQKSQKWRKYNDIQVTEVSFEEVERDSFGDYQSTSAYCLVYVDVRKIDMFEAVDNVTESQLLAGLPPDLQQLVSEDNDKFMSELSEWDRKHYATSTPAAPTPSPTGGAPARNVAQVNETELAGLIETHGRLSARTLREYLGARTISNLETEGSSVTCVDSVLEKLVDEKLSTTKNDADKFLRRICMNPLDVNAAPKWHICLDERAERDVQFYAYCWIRCGGGKRFGAFDEQIVLRRLTLDFFANPNLIGPSSLETFTEIYQAAKRAIGSSSTFTPAELQVYGRIYYDYQLYLETIILLVHSLEKFNAGAFGVSLQAIMCAKTNAERLMAQSANAGSIDEEFVLSCIRMIAMHLSQHTVKEIQAAATDEEVIEKVKFTKSNLLPCLIELTNRYGDVDTLESVRAGWLAAILDEQNALPAAKSREVKEFLEALMDVETAVADGRFTKPGMNAKVKLQSDIGARYKTALRIAGEHGILQCHQAEQPTPIVKQ